MKQIILLFALLFAMNGNVNASTITNNTSCEYYLYIYCAPPGNCSASVSSIALTAAVFVVATSTVPIPTPCATGPFTSVPYYKFYKANEPNCPGLLIYDTGDFRFSFGPEQCSGPSNTYNFTPTVVCGCWVGASSHTYTYDPAKGNLLIN